MPICACVRAATRTHTRTHTHKPERAQLLITTLAGSTHTQPSSSPHPSVRPSVCRSIARSVCLCVCQSVGHYGSQLTDAASRALPRQPATRQLPTESPSIPVSCGLRRNTPFRSSAPAFGSPRTLSAIVGVFAMSAARWQHRVTSGRVRLASAHRRPDAA